MSKICKQCGGVLRETATFCGKCGSKYLQEMQQKRYCTKCGNLLGEKASYCGNCGSKAEQAKPEKPKPEQLKLEQAKPEQAKPEQQRQEQPRPEQAKPEQPKQELPRPEQPRPEQPRPEQPRIEQPDPAVIQEKQDPSKVIETVVHNSTNTRTKSIHTPVKVAAVAASTVGKLFENDAEAIDMAGEVSFTQALPSPGSLLQLVNPIKHLLGGFLRIIKGIALAGKDIKRIIPALILAILWFTLTLLPVMGIDMSSVRWLNWLTFAQGGLRGGITGIVGGVIGKGIVAYLITGVFASLINKQNPFKAYINGAKKFFSAFALKNLHQTALLILGAGLSLIAFNFMTWNASSMNNMAGIAAFFLAIRSMSSRYGFLKMFATSLITKKGCPVDMVAVNRLMGGWAMGFAFGSALSFVKFAYVGYVAGGAAIIVAMVLFIASAQRKGAVTV